jgi:hypothetical protein
VQRSLAVACKYNNSHLAMAQPGHSCGSSARVSAVIRAQHMQRHHRLLSRRTHAAF